MNRGGNKSLASSRLVPQELLDRNGYCYGDFWLGRTLNGHGFGWREDLNLLTCAGPRSGKGVGVVVPNLMEFPGSAVVIDPKGELADMTADYRRRVLGQKVIVLDPAGAATNIPDELYGTFNPLAGLDVNSPHTVGAAQTIAAGIVVPQPDSKDPFWDQSAIAFIQALILYMAVHYAPENMTLTKLRETASVGDMGLFDGFLASMREDDPDYQPDAKKPFELLLQEMFATDAFDGIVREAAASIMEMGEQTRGNVLGNVRTHLSFLNEPALKQSVQDNPDPDTTFELSEFRRQDQHLTVYLCLPIDMMYRQGRWMRLIVSRIIQYIERTQSAFDKNRDLPVLMMLDEFFQLGPMPQIVNTLTYAPGAGLRVWLIIQDLNQLKMNYPKTWETIVGACGIKQFFGVNDLTTAKYISELVGECEIEVPSITITETQSYAEGTTESDAYGTSNSAADGVSSSLSAGRSSSDSFGVNSSTGYGTSTSISDSHSSSDSHGFNSSASTGSNYGGGQSINRRANGTGGLNEQTNLGGSQNTSFGTNYGQSKGESSSRSHTAGLSNTYGTSSNLSTGSSFSQTSGLSQTETQGGSQTWTQGTSQTRSQGRTLSSSTGQNFGLTLSLQVRRVLRYDEVLTSFTKDNLLQLVHVRDQGGMILFRTPFYADPDFQAKIDEYNALVIEHANIVGLADDLGRMQDAVDQGTSND